MFTFRMDWVSQAKKSAYQTLYPYKYNYMHMRQIGTHGTSIQSKAHCVHVSIFCLGFMDFALTELDL